MKDRGNKSFKNGDYYDALWKYQHACLLCCNYSSLKTDIAVLHSNIAAACLKLGDAKKRDLLDPLQYPTTCCHPLYVLWYAFTKHHASEAIKQSSEPKIKQKVSLLKMEINCRQVSASINMYLHYYRPFIGVHRALGR